MNQESGTESEILEFVRAKGANFDVFAKVDVNGENASELFKYLRLNSNLQGGIIGWNFGKFLVGKDENSIEYFGPTVMPSEIKEKILKGL